jgi:hypothetical protein
MDFMLQVFSLIEPICITEGKIILDEHGECTEVIFIDHGQVAIGYEVNRKVQFVNIRKDYCIIGVYEICYEMRS